MVRTNAICCFLFVMDNMYQNDGEESYTKPYIRHMKGIADSLSCSHSRARDLFIESINSQCQFYGHRCPSSDQFESGKCLGCPSGGCPVMGYGADQSKTGVYFLSTSGTPPYCGHEYFVEVHVSQLTLHTYGEFIITLVGTHATGEPLKFESLMQSYNRGEVERHVISSHVNLGTVTSVKLQFVKATGLHGVLAQNSIRIHSVIVEPAENSIQQKFCAHEQSVHSGQTITISSHSRC